MELRHLRYFAAVAKHGNFTKAANEVHTVQSSLSRQIQDLEYMLGLALIDRGKGKFALTKAGEVFLAEAHKTLQQADRAVERARQAARDEHKKITIGFLPGTEFELLQHALDFFQVKMGLGPDNIEIYSLPSPQLSDMLDRRKVDIAFMRKDDRSPSLRFIAVRDDEICLIAPRKAARKLNELLERRIVAISEDVSPVLHRMLQQHISMCPQPPEMIHAENIPMALALILTHDAYSLLPAYVLNFCDQSRYDKIPLQEPVRLKLYVGYHRDNQHELVLEFVKKYAEDIDI